MARQILEEITYQQLSQMAADQTQGEKPLEELFSKIKRKLSQPFVNMEQYVASMTGVSRPNRIKNNNRHKRHSLHEDSLKYNYERIELAHFGDNLFSGDQNERTVRDVNQVTGHDFVLTPITNPAFCDFCRDPIWGMTKKCLRCSHCKYTCHHRCRQQVRLDCEPGPSAYSTHSATLPYSHSNHLSNNHSNHYTPIAHIPTPIVNGRRDDGLAAIPGLVANGDLNRDLDHDSAEHSSRYQRRHSASASSPVQETPPSTPSGAPAPPSESPPSGAPPSSSPPAPKSPSTPTPLSDSSSPPSLSHTSNHHHDDSGVTESAVVVEDSSSSSQARITAVGSSHTINGGVSASEVEVVLISPYATAPLRQRLDMYNRRVTKQPDTLHLTDADTFQGFIRVTLNLSRPINMSVGVRPPSIYDLLAHQEGAPPPPENAPPRLETMSFYIPKDTIKSLHISSKTTAGEVITELLHKFSITDSPRKFALYEQYRDPETKQLKIRKLADKERPLDLLLAWQEVGEERKFLLQENETGDIMWEAFSIPELQNFLRILQREEEEHISQIKTKFKLTRLQLNVKMRDAQEYEQAQGKLEFKEEGSTPTPKANESFA